MDGTLGRHRYYHGSLEPQEFFNDQASKFQHPENEALQFLRAVKRNEIYFDRKNVEQLLMTPPSFDDEELTVGFANLQDKKGGLFRR